MVTVIALMTLLDTGSGMDKPVFRKGAVFNNVGCKGRAVSRFTEIKQVTVITA
jgi:hypothetical protein